MEDTGKSAGCALKEPREVGTRISTTALSQDRTRLCGKCKEGWSDCGADSGVGAPLQSPTGTCCFRKCSQQAFRDEMAMRGGK